MTTFSSIISMAMPVINAEINYVSDEDGNPEIADMVYHDENDNVISHTHLYLLAR